MFSHDYPKLWHVPGNHTVVLVWLFMMGFATRQILAKSQLNVKASGQLVIICQLNAVWGNVYENERSESSWGPAIRSDQILYSIVSLALGPSTRAFDKVHYGWYIVCQRQQCGLGYSG